MSAPRTYWVGQQFVAEWALVDVDGQPVTGATVTGVVTRPDGTTAAMAVTAAATYRASYLAATPGSHTFQLTATGATVDVVQGTFVVARDQVAAPPITVDPTTDVGMVRLLVTDLDETQPLFTDRQIEALLTAEGGVKRAAAAALETVARSETLIAKKISTQDLTTDGPAVARELRESAKALRDQASTEVDALDDFGMDVVDFDPAAGYRWW